MNFIEAIKMVKKGKKVRLPIWGENVYYYLNANNGEISLNDNGNNKTEAKIDIVEIECNDWQILEENKTLSDKIGDESPGCLTAEEVKEAIKEFVERVYTEVDVTENKKLSDFWDIAKEIFGRRLI